MLRRSALRRIVPLLLIAGILFSSAAPGSAFLQTIGDFLSLGANTVREIQEAIGIAGGEVRTTLQSLQGTINELLDELEETYQNNLNITIDSIDAATRNKLLELESLLLSVNEVLQDDVRFITNEARQLLQDASLEIRQLTDGIKQDLQDVIIVGGETGAFLVERTTENIIIIASIILLAIGVLIFVGIFFRSGGKINPVGAMLGFILIVAYIGFFGALVLVPQFRGWVMSTTGLGLRDRLESVTLQPSVFAVIPDEIIVGETTEIDVWGSSLMPNEQQPTITIGEVAIPFTASGDRIVLDVSAVIGTGDTLGTGISIDPSRIVLQPDQMRDLLMTPAAPTLDIEPADRPDSGSTERVTGVLIERKLLEELDVSLIQPGIVGDWVRVDPSVFGSIPLPEGASVLRLDYAEFTDVTAIIRVTVPEPPAAPPDLRVTSFTLQPSSITEGDNVRARITVRNDGELPAQNFNVVWRPTPSLPQRTQNVSSLAPGASQTFEFNLGISSIGTFTSVAEVDTLNRVTESNEGNNSRTASLTVNERPPRTAQVTVRFTGVTVHDDADPFDSGEIILRFNVNGRTARYPNSGADSGVSSGDFVSFVRSLTVTLTEGENLTVNVEGVEKDLGGFPDEDDGMGTVSRTYNTGQNWGSGSHQVRSTCPDGCYTIFYTITVVDN